MRIVQLTPGTGNFHCGNCLRDEALVRALRRAGHEVTMVPLYLPQVLDGEPGENDAPLFFGGINVYLQGKLGFFRRTPRWFDHLLDSPRLLRFAANRADMTTAHDLGSLTVSMLEGEQGRQNKEMDKLVEFLLAGPKPDVACLSNAMLAGLAPRLKRDVGCRVACTLSGEDAFLDSLIEPWRSRAWQTLRQRAEESIDVFIAVSGYYRDTMAERLRIDPAKIRVVHNGIDPTGFEAAADPPATPTVGYLARLHPSKGLHTLVDAFLDLMDRGTVPDANLHVAGAATPGDEKYIEQQKQKLADAGLSDRSKFETNLSADRKHEFLRSLSVLSVPATYGEAFGLYVIEAWAAGVPVVQPRHGAFPELLHDGAAGILCHPDDPTDLATGLERMLLDPSAAAAMGRAGRRKVLESFHVDRMADGVLDAFAARSPETAAGRS